MCAIWKDASDVECDGESSGENCPEIISEFIGGIEKEFAPSPCEEIAVDDRLEKAEEVETVKMFVSRL
jgi:hypothetical protein